MAIKKYSRPLLIIFSTLFYLLKTINDAYFTMFVMIIASFYHRSPV